MAERTQTYRCDHCGEEATRKLARGQRPRWCPDCRANSVWLLHEGECRHCGENFTGTGKQFCSVTCANRDKQAGRPKKNRPPKLTPAQLTEVHRSQRSALRASIEDGDHQAALAELRRLTTESPTGCWIWSRRTSKDGYPTVRFANRTHFVHRLALEAKWGRPLGSQAAHHTCAVTDCVNPDHLQPVTHRDNTAEMLARRAYTERIRELEDALCEADPNHPLLNLVPVR